MFPGNNVYAEEEDDPILRAAQILWLLENPPKWPTQPITRRQNNPNISTSNATSPSFSMPESHVSNGMEVSDSDRQFVEFLDHLNKRACDDDVEEICCPVSRQPAESRCSRPAGAVARGSAVEWNAPPAASQSFEHALTMKRAVLDRMPDGFGELVSQSDGGRHVQELGVSRQCNNINSPETDRDLPQHGSTSSTPSQKRDANKRPNNGMDLNERPKQRPRKKKYWPKVVGEGRPKRTPKPKTPEPATPKRVGKRKHVRKSSPKNLFTSLDATVTNREDDGVGEKVVCEAKPKRTPKLKAPKLFTPNPAEKNMSGKRKYVTKSKNKNLITPTDKDNVSGDKIYSVASTCKRALRFDLENQSLDAGCTQKETMNFLAEKHPCLSNEQNRLPEQNLIENVPDRTSHCTLVLEEQEQIALGPTSRHGNAPTKSEGMHEDTMHILVRKLMCMCISDGQKSQNQLLVLDKNVHSSNSRAGTLVPYQELDQNAHDPTNNQAALVPYQGPLEPTKKRRAVAKVNLDPETMRVWNQLMDKKPIGESETKEDEEKEKWWAEERNIFHGRVNAFLAVMNDIQGDRRFTPWKGSVVDSVVGVFLTQNVSDHLSSSAYMSLAAKFPSSNHIAGHANLQTTDSQESVGSNAEPVGATVNISKSDELLISEIKPDELQNGTETLATSAEGAKLEETMPATIQEAATVDSYSLSNFSLFPECIPQAEGGMKKGKRTHFLAEKRLVDEPESLVNEMVQSQKGKMQPANVDNAIINKNRRKRENENLEEIFFSSGMAFDETKTATRTTKAKKIQKEEEIDWDELRKLYSHVKSSGDHMDSVDWEAVKRAENIEIAKAIQERGQQNIIAGRIKDFLDRVVTLHNRIDLEWLRNVPPDLAKEYLLKINGLGLKSVECVRLLSLENIAFPVDTNVGRIAVRLGWVPLQPLPENVQIHLLEQYPLMDTIQKYIWPRLCTLDQRSLYELHYQMITFGKVFCTKKNPNCNACPIKGDCKHFASAFASARLALPSPVEKSSIISGVPGMKIVNPDLVTNPASLFLLEPNPFPGSGNQSNNCEPIIEEPASPEPEWTEPQERDIEDLFDDNCDGDEIPTIRLGFDKISPYLPKPDESQLVMLHDHNMSRALVALSAEAASIPMPKLKNVSRLRTEHQVYILPDSHLLISGLDKREDDDPCPYLFVIWKPGETANSYEPPTNRCNSKSGELCNEEACFCCNSIREQNSNTIRGTILIPSRTALKGRFPLNGTYFQVNEVFADDETSQNPIHVSREWIWHLERRTAYFASSATAVFRGLSADAIRSCFKEGFICVRGFDRSTGAPRPLSKRLHLSANKMGKARMDD